MRRCVLLLSVLAASCGARSGLLTEAPPAATFDAGTSRDAEVLADRRPIPLDSFAALDSFVPPDDCVGEARWSVFESPTTEDLYDVFSLSRDDVWIVGASGTILHWDGLTLTREASPTTENLGAIWMGADGSGWMVSSDSLFRRDGARWTRHARPALPGIATISTVWGRAADDVWFGGGSVSPRVGLHARWDGTSIALVDGEPTGIQVLNMRGSDDGRAIWSTSQLGLLARTVDGAPWELVPQPVGSTSIAVWAPSADEAWLSGTGQIHHWSAGEWERFDVGGDRSHYYAVWGSSSADVWAVGYEGAAAHVEDRAASVVTLPVSVSLFAIDGSCATDAWAVGSDGTILRLSR